MNKSDLKIDWATHKAAEYACKNWHYSKCLPVGKTVRIGAWEKDKFIGVVLFARGANLHLGSPYGLEQDQVSELSRVALTKHESPVSRIMALSLKFLKHHCPGLRLVVSFADQQQGHHGGIYIKRQIGFIAGPAKLQTNLLKSTVKSDTRKVSIQ